MFVRQPLSDASQFIEGWRGWGCRMVCSYSAIILEKLGAVSYSKSIIRSRTMVIFIRCEDYQWRGRNNE